LVAKYSADPYLKKIDKFAAKVEEYKKKCEADGATLSFDAEAFNILKYMKAASLEFKKTKDKKFLQDIQGFFTENLKKSPNFKPDEIIKFFNESEIIKNAIKAKWAERKDIDKLCDLILKIGDLRSQKDPDKIDSDVNGIIDNIDCVLSVMDKIMNNLEKFMQEVLMPAMGEFMGAVQTGIESAFDKAAEKMKTFDTVTTKDEKIKSETSRSSAGLKKQETKNPDILTEQGIYWYVYGHYGGPSSDEMWLYLVPILKYKLSKDKKTITIDWQAIDKKNKLAVVYFKTKADINKYFDAEVLEIRGYKEIPTDRNSLPAMDTKAFKTVCTFTGKEGVINKLKVQQVSFDD
jgi:hypothetical protein